MGAKLHGPSVACHRNEALQPPPGRFYLVCPCVCVFVRRITQKLLVGTTLGRGMGHRPGKNPLQFAGDPP